MENEQPSTSEATPPQVDASPEMVNQPSPPPEEQRVSSSSDSQPQEVADSPVEPSVSSTSRDPDPNERPVQNLPRPTTSSPTLLRLLLATDPLPISDQVRVEDALRDGASTGAAVAVPVVASALASKERKLTASADEGTAQVIPKKKIEQNLQKIDFSNLQFDVDDSSSGSKSSHENIDSSPAGSDVQDENKEIESVTESAGLESNLSPEIAIASKDGPEIGSEEAVGLENQQSPSRSGDTETIGLSKSSSTTIDVIEPSGSDNAKAAVLSESSPTTNSTSQVSGSGFAKAVGTSESSTISMEASGSGEAVTLSESSTISMEASGSGEAVTLSESFTISMEASGSGEAVALSESSTSSMEASGSGDAEAVALSESSTSSIKASGSADEITIKLSESSAITSSIQVSESGAGTTGGSKMQLSASSSDSTTLDTQEKREKISPKRKSPAKVEHLEPKRYAPCSSERRRSDSQMSTLLKDLDIQETTSDENIEYLSREDEEISVEIVVTDETQNEETMDMQETEDEQTEDGTKTKYTKSNDDKMEESD